jgi:hypothetical protein
MESLIQLDGATLLFPVSSGYFDLYMLRTAAKYKDTRSGTSEDRGRKTSTR